jgi:uncharacterized protein YeeX (DUF496 family)
VYTGTRERDFIERSIFDNQQHHQRDQKRVAAINNMLGYS